MPYNIKTPAKLNTGDVYWKGGNVSTNTNTDRLQYDNKSDTFIKRKQSFNIK